MRTWFEKNGKLVKWIIGGMLLSTFLITRLLWLDRLPFGLDIDEAGMAYDAWNLARYGVDRYLKSWPVYLTNFGAGQSSLYAFICAILFKIFGYSIRIVRMPAFFFSALTLVFGMKLADKLYSENIWKYLTGFFITVCPVFVMLSRVGLDCNLMLGASTVFLYFLLLALKEGKWWQYFVAGVCGGILLYTYALTYIILPFFLLCVLGYTIFTHRFALKKWIVMGIPLCILAIPLILVQIINLADLDEKKLGVFTLTKLDRYRASELGFFRPEHFFEALRCIFVGDRFLFDSIPGICNLCLCTILLFLVGLTGLGIHLGKTLKKRYYDSKILILFWFLVILLFESHMEVTTYRINGIFVATVLIAVYGLKLICCFMNEKAQAMKGYLKKTVLCLLLIVGLCYGAELMRFHLFYFTEYTEKTFPITWFGVTFKEGSDLIEQDEDLRQKMTFVSELGIYYAIGSKPSPYEFDIVGDRSLSWNNYYFGSLQEISDDYNYIIRDGYEDYCEALKSAGFEEVKFDHYAVYYKR